VTNELARRTAVRRSPWPWEVEDEVHHRLALEQSGVDKQDELEAELMAAGKHEPDT
jgi:hypothetical protein